MVISIFITIVGLLAMLGLQLEKYPLDTLVQMVMNGEIEDAKTVAAVLKTKRIVDAKK